MNIIVNLDWYWLFLIFVVIIFCIIFFIFHKSKTYSGFTLGDICIVLLTAIWGYCILNINFEVLSDSSTVMIICSTIVACVGMICGTVYLVCKEKSLFKFKETQCKLFTEYKKHKKTMEYYKP